MTILSIQSQVAYGHVGNAAAVFPLQRLGYEVWPVATVQFSNHPGYGDWRGRVLPASEVADVIEGIGERGVYPQCRAILSGYLGCLETGRVVLGAAAEIKAANPDALYVCDPVMGDHEEGFYVGDEQMAFFKSEAVPSADMVIANTFEMEFLSGLAIGSSAAAVGAADVVGRDAARMVVVTSVTVDDADAVGTVAVTGTNAWLVTTPRIPVSAKGAGDTFTALFLARYLQRSDPGDALALAVSSVFGLIRAGFDGGTRELPVVAAQREIVSPARLFPAEKIR